MADQAITSARRQVLLAVLRGQVHVRKSDGCRVCPRGVSGTSLTAAHRAGLWKWERHPEDGEVAVLTDAGTKACRAAVLGDVR